MRKTFFLLILIQPMLSFSHEEIPVRIFLAEGEKRLRITNPSQVPILKQYEEIFNRFRKPWPTRPPRLGRSYWNGFKVVEEKPIRVEIELTPINNNRGYLLACGAPRAEIRHITVVKRTYDLDRRKHAHYWGKIKEVASGVTAGIGLIPLTPAYGTIIAGKLAQKAGRRGHAQALEYPQHFTRIEKDIIRTILACPKKI